MIELKIQDLLNSTDALQKLAKMNLKARLAWQVGKLLKVIDEEIQDFNKTRIEVIKKYGNKDENGELITDDKGNCKIEGSNLAIFNKELEELAETKIELQVNRIKISDLEDLDFTPAEMVQLEMFLDMEDEE